MSEDAEEKTEQPTERKLREAREQGRVPRSRELNGAAVFGAAVAILLATGGTLMVQSIDWMRGALTFAPTGPSQESLLARVGHLFGDAALAAAPIIGLCLLAGILSPLALGGFNFSAKAMTPQFNRLNPAAGLKRLYGGEALAELLRALIKVAAIGTVMFYLLRNAVPEFLALPAAELPVAAAAAFQPIRGVLIAFCAILVFVAALDVPWQLFSHGKQLRMTRQQVRDEMKESEGRPEVKHRIRHLQQQMSQRRMMEDVPRADVILVNPTHYAVALKYDAGKQRAPRVVAKGLDEVALAIRRVADAHDVPILESPPLARALYRQAQIGQEIPVGLYTAVAQILGYIYQLRTWRREGGRAPLLPRVDVADEGDAR